MTDCHNLQRAEYVRRYVQHLMQIIEAAKTVASGCHEWHVDPLPGDVWVAWPEISEEYEILGSVLVRMRKQ